MGLGEGGAEFLGCSCFGLARYLVLGFGLGLGGRM